MMIKRPYIMNKPSDSEGGDMGMQILTKWDKMVDFVREQEI